MIDDKIINKFVPIESSHRLRVCSRKDDGKIVYWFELVNKKYEIIQKIHIGTNDIHVKSIIAKLKSLGVAVKVIERGIKEFYKKYE